MDILGCLPRSDSGNKNILVITDAFTRYCELVLVPDKTAKIVVALFKVRILDRHNSPSVLVTDNGSKFNNQLFDELCKHYRVDKCNIVPHHPASNGLIQRLNRKILNALCTNLNYSHGGWDELVSFIQCTLNLAFH